MMIIGRNDLCSCGSGKKYKKCCMIYENNPIKLWEKNFSSISSEIQQSQTIENIFFSILKIIHEEKWEGACHATSAIMYVILNELKMNPQIYIGEVQYGNYIFDHSWIEIDNRVYDAAVSMGLNGNVMSPPIAADYSLGTLKKTDGKYGIKIGEGLAYPANQIKNMSISEYMNSFPNFDIGLWKIVNDIGIKLGLNFDIVVLREKYSTERWKVR